ncbi:MAG: hypothetical protein J5911_04550 [Clostridia bacterium]|nr:hypothetical protein [Clostridia bacterium]
MTYILTILFASIAIGAINYFFNFAAFDFNAWNIVLVVSVSVVAVIAIDGIFATLVRRAFPAKWFSVEKECWAAKKKECVFYEKIGIKKWKEKVIELGCFTSFRKNKIADPNNNEYVGRYILEANFGVAIHITGVILGYLVCLVFPKHWCFVGLPVGFVNMVLNWLPLMILRYNLPKLHQLYRINEKRAKRRAAAMESDEDSRSA